MKIVITIDTENDEVKVVTDEQKSVQSITEKEPKMVDPSVSKYARFFDEKSIMYRTCTNVEGFLKAMDRTANDLLKEKGHLYLNDVYELLGLSATEDGKKVGWIYDLENPNGDNYVDLGIYEYRNWKALRGDKDHKIILDFNVDGVIIDKL